MNIKDELLSAIDTVKLAGDLMVGDNGRKVGLPGLKESIKSSVLRVFNQQYGEPETIETRGADINIVFKPGLLGSINVPIIYEFIKFLQEKYKANIHVPSSPTGYFGLLNVCSGETGAKAMEESTDEFLHTFSDVPVMFMGQSKGGVDIMQYLTEKFADEKANNLKERIGLVAFLNSAIMGTHVRPGLAPKILFGNDIVNDLGDLDARTQKVRAYMKLQIPTLITSTFEDRIVPLDSAIPHSHIMGNYRYVSAHEIQYPPSHWNAYTHPKEIMGIVDETLTTTS